MKVTLSYKDAIPNDAELLSSTAFKSKKIWGYADELMQLWETDLKITGEYIQKNKVVKVFNKELFVGFFAIKFGENGIAELDHLWLVPAYIRQEYGKKIFTHITNYLALNGHVKMMLVAEPNATGFYEKMDGEVIGKFQSKINGRVLDIYEFQLSLDN